MQKVWTGGQAFYILKILMATICISLFKSVYKNLFFYFMFCFFLVLFIFFAKSVDRWTSSKNSDNFNDIGMYFIIQKCGYVDKKLSFYFIFSLFLVPFKFLSKSVDRWTSSEKISNPCMPLLESTVYFFAKSVDRWTSSNKNQPHMIYIIDR